MSTGTNETTDVVTDETETPTPRFDLGEDGIGGYTLYDTQSDGAIFFGGGLEGLIIASQAQLLLEENPDDLDKRIYGVTAEYAHGITSEADYLSTSVPDDVFRYHGATAEGRETIATDRAAIAAEHPELIK